MKKIGPQVTPETEKYLLSNFRNLNAGSEYIMQALPHVTRRFFGLDIKGRFSHDEICLMIDVMNGTILTPRTAGQHILLNVQDGMTLDGLDQKWGVDGPALIGKISKMSTPDLMFLEIWVQGFWNQNGKVTLERYIEPLLNPGTTQKKGRKKMKEYCCSDGNQERKVLAETPLVAAQEYVKNGCWNVDKTCWVSIAVDEDENMDNHEEFTIAIDPQEPECTESKHNWESPHTLVGGLKENPGVLNHGGGVINIEVCKKCGIYRIKDTWAQNPETGEQGLESIEYKPANDESIKYYSL